MIKAEMKADRKPAAITFLRCLKKGLPGNFLKTAFYLNFIAKPRKFFRLVTSQFYRMDHIYEVLWEARRNYKGKFSIMEFGTNDGYSFTKMLYATKYTGMSDRVTVHAFDSFEGMPAPADRSDINIITNKDEWVEGQFYGHYENLMDYCDIHYTNHKIHKGYFARTLTDEFLSSLVINVPILIWFDCDYYSSSRVVFGKILPYLPSGCVLYFDEYEWNYGSRFTGEAKLVYEINKGLFGEEIELVLDTNLSWNTQRIYRLVRFRNGPYYELLNPPVPDVGRLRTDDSPLP
jgi:hypothetical protein